MESVRPGDPKRRYLHTMERPLCTDGALRPDTSAHPEGHLLADGRTRRASRGGSALFSRTILFLRAVIGEAEGDDWRRTR